MGQGRRGGRVPGRMTSPLETDPQYLVRSVLGYDFDFRGVGLSTNRALGLRFCVVAGVEWLAGAEAWRCSLGLGMDTRWRYEVGLATWRVYPGVALLGMLGLGRGSRSVMGYEGNRVYKLAAPPRRVIKLYSTSPPPPPLTYSTYTVTSPT